jgi:UDP-N-acetylmuramoyl-tripeptide--D-alanyl-D-alanine ligase
MNIAIELQQTFFFFFLLIPLRKDFDFYFFLATIPSPHINMNYLLLTLWFVKTLSVVPQTTYYWQLKEYRWDRMKAFFLQQGGRQVFFSVFDIIMAIALLLGFFLLYLPAQAIVDPLLFSSVIGVLFLAQIFENSHLLFKRKWKRPRLTIKALLIMALTVGIEFSLILGTMYMSQFELSLSSLTAILALLSVLDHDVNAFAVFILNTLSNFQKRKLYKKARQKRLSMSDLKVIGITGSYGKSSVKEFLSQILSTEFEVLKTAKNTNTEIGIANTILKSLKKNHQIFVCEMGAYKIGEIRVCCAMAKPQIGIFTGLNEQHVALFGSLDNTFKAKWELVQSLSAEGHAIVNADSYELKSRLKPFRGNLIKVSSHFGDLHFKDLEVETDKLTFTYKHLNFSANLVGGFHAVNVLMAIVAAEQLGMTLQSIQKAVLNLKAPEKTMELKKISRGYIIDESYHVNPDGLRAALKHLDTFKDHIKILFFPGILELGDNAEVIHRSLGEEIANHVDKVFFFDPNFADFLEKGALSGGLTRSDIHLSTKYEEQLEQLKTILEAYDQDAVFLFESRGAEKIMEWLMTKT